MFIHYRKIFFPKFMFFWFPHFVHSNDISVTAFQLQKNLYPRPHEEKHFECGRNETAVSRDQPEEP